MLIKNQEIANILYEIAYFLEMEGISFKPYAYEKAAITIENLKEDIAKIYKEGGTNGLEKIPGIGKSIAEKIEEYLKTGKIKYYSKLKIKMPVKMNELVRVEGLGPKKIKTLYQELDIRNIKDLEAAAREHKIALLPGFGKNSERNILEGIRFLKRSEGRFLLGEIFDEARFVYEKLKGLKEVERIDFAGSMRRRKETVGDIDFLVTVRGLQGSSFFSARADIIMNYFVSLPGVEKIWSKGKTRASVKMKRGFDMDIRVLPRKSYGAALQYFTGSKEHNIALRKIAIDRKLKLSEYGLFRGSKVMPIQKEEDIYKALGMDWIPPEMRENQGEIELALGKKLPKIINRGDIKGDFHCHSDWNGGKDAIEEIMKTAIETKYEYIGIADHTKFLKIENGLDEKQLILQGGEIDKLNTECQTSNVKFRILQGCEANILNNGSVDIENESLEKLDYAIAGIHSSFKMTKKEMTERIIKAMKNPYINIISHPTGRILKKRDEYRTDFDKILRAAKATKTVLEINACPQRLDLGDTNIKKAKEMGVKMTINSDLHQKDQIHYMNFGVAQARRGWAEKNDILNTLPVEEVLKIFNEKSKRYS